MPINAPFMFVDEERLEAALSTLDPAQQRVIPVLQAQYVVPGLGQRVFQQLVQQAQQFGLSLPMTLVKAAAGQLHQESMVASALLDTLYLTGKH